MNNEEKLNEFAAKIEALDIEVSRTENGVYTVYSNSEPYFCFEGFERQELGAKVIKALESYASNYFDIQLGLKVKPVELKEPSVVVERSTPISKFSVELEAA